MANENKDQSVLSHIEQLVKEEERLYGKSGLTGDGHARLGGTERISSYKLMLGVPDRLPAICPQIRDSSRSASRT